MSAAKKEWVIVNATDDVLTLPKTMKGCYRELAKIDSRGRTWQEIRDEMESGVPSKQFANYEDDEWTVYTIVHTDDIELYGQDDIY